MGLFSEFPLNEQSLIGGEWHGTRVAGIIGALRNNGKGVCGIAGGDYRHLESQWLDEVDSSADLETTVIKGVQMNAYKVGQGITIATEQAAEAILLAVTNDFEQNWGDACHILNNSWGTGSIGLGFPWRMSPIYDAQIAKNYWFANRNGVVNFTARGNNAGDDDRIVYPACYYNHWLISVGASGKNGERTNTSLKGFNIDVLGPETVIPANIGEQPWLVHTTTLDFGQNSIYESFYGTSAGTPHATGIGSLMLSSFNEIGESSLNLYPSDVESLIETTAKNYGNLGGYSDENGWGVPKGEAVMQLLTTPENIISHFETSFSSIDLQLVEQNLSVTIPLFDEDNSVLNEGVYLVNKYTIEEQVSFTIPNGYTPMASWALPEATNGFMDTYSNFGTQYLFLDEMSEIVDVSNLSTGNVTLRTHVYHVVADGQGNQINEWFPNSSEYTIPYTVHFQQNVIQNTEEIPNGDLLIFPNPAMNILNFNITDGSTKDLKIYVYDLSGSLILATRFVTTLDISELASGFYVVNVKGNNTIYTGKFCKL